MIKIVDKSYCCGCEACVQVCPKQCISFTQDHEGFFYPKVDESLCIDCGMCEKVCPVLQQFEKRIPLKTLAAINLNDEIRMTSSSGGIFTLLADKIIDAGGVVFGARFNEQWQVVFDAAETKDGLKAFQGSKYLQARIGDCYQHCKRFLDEGREVLFSGTPCQIAGLLHFLRKPYRNLLTVDFVCHGVPSPKVWKYYLEEVIATVSERVNNIQFRDKSRGWKDFSFILEAGSDVGTFTISSPFRQNEYMQAFLSNLILRPSCHACPAKSNKSHSDITIADFWGIESVNSEMDDDKGTSLVLINTDKGVKLLPLDKMKFTEEKFADAIKNNPYWAKPAIAHHRRDEFFAKFDTHKSIISQIFRAFRPTLRQRLSIVKHPRRLAMKFVRGLIGGKN